ncbi:MAG TPA: hypothetical protein ACFYED_00240 [Candidatus Tripitaka californicus]|uniref:hypothetical protein n=1 Tax=Candidatus Tripitaka californicus TaxID=3367616 RepID=UPI00402A55C6
MGKYSFKREKVETNFLRPRYIAWEGEGMSLKGLINLTTKQICWGIVDDKDNFIAPNQQLKYNPWTGAILPLTTDKMRTVAR